MRKVVVALVALVLTIGGCGPATDKTTRMAVSSPYIGAAVRDLLGDETPLINLAGPNMCPGHFDMRPSQLRELAACRMLLRFDFQEGLDRKLAGRNKGPKIVAVTALGGLCVPQTYLSVCRQLARQFTADGTLGRTDAERRLSKIERRMAGLQAEAKLAIDAAGLHEAPVICSEHQADFCRWLGLRVAARFTGADTASTGGIDRAVSAAASAGAKIVVANRPEGRRAADALADRLTAGVVVFDNFPDPSVSHANGATKPHDGQKMPTDQPVRPADADQRFAAFDAMVRANISALTQLNVADQ